MNGVKMKYFYDQWKHKEILKCALDKNLNQINLFYVTIKMWDKRTFLNIQQKHVPFLLNIESWFSFIFKTNLSKTLWLTLYIEVLSEVKLGFDLFENF